MEIRTLWCFVALGLVPDGAHSVLKGTQRYSVQRYSKDLCFVALGLVPDGEHSVLIPYSQVLKGTWGALRAARGPGVGRARPLRSSVTRAWGPSSGA